MHSDVILSIQGGMSETEQRKNPPSHLCTHHQSGMSNIPKPEVYWTLDIFGVK